MKIVIQTPAYATEDEAMVEAAAKAFLDGQAEWSDRGGRRHLTFTGRDPMLLRQRIWEQRIIDSFRGQMSFEGDQVRFIISKQAAAGGKLALPAAPHALGELAWTVTLEEADEWDAEGFVWWLCPQTADGEIVKGAVGPPPPTVDEDE